MDSLSIFVCSNLAEELAQVIKLHELRDVNIVPLKSDCRKALLTNASIRSYLNARNISDCANLLIIGGVCMSQLDASEFPGLRVHRLENCFELLLNKSILHRQISQGCYIISSGWLRHAWEIIPMWGFDEHSIKEFFAESARKIMFLDTGIMPDYEPELQKVAAYLGLEYEVTEVSLDHLDYLIQKEIMQWRYEKEKNFQNANLANLTRKTADYAMIFDQLNFLADLRSEAEIVHSTMDIFRLMFSAQKIIYLPIENGKEGKLVCYPESLAVNDIICQRSCLDSYDPQTEILIRMREKGQETGVFKLMDFTFPHYLSHYRQLAEFLASVSSLGISNARNFINLQEKEHRISQYAVELLTQNEDLEKHVQERTLQLTAALDEIDDFAYSLSHDLRTPLRGIDGFSAVLMEDYGSVLDSQAVNHLNNIRRDAQRLGEVLDALHGLTNVSRKKLTTIPTNLSKMAEELFAQHRNSYPDRIIEYSIQPGIVAICDPALIKIALSNLISNAIKFSNQQAVARIEFGMQLMDRSWAYFVKDNGVGFNMDFVNKLFHNFQRLHKYADYEGIGIGLATVRRVIIKHGGKIWAVSKSGQGAVFYFTLSPYTEHAQEIS